MNNKVMHICPYYGNSWIYNQLNNLIRYTPIVLYDEEMKPHLYSIPHSYSLSNLNKFSVFFNKGFRKIFGFYPYFWGIARQYKPTLIHAHFGPWGYKSLAFKKILNIPLVTTFYGYDMSILPKTAEWQKKFHLLFKSGDAFLTEGSHMKQALIKLGCPEEKIVIQHIGVNIDKIEFHPRTAKNTKKIKILICGNFVEKKGIPYGILAFARTKKKFPNTELRIVGDGPLRKKIENLIKELNLTNCVMLLGDLDYPRYLEELEKSQILLAPSITATNGDTEGGAPVVLTEAQASGLPIVSTYHADIPEVVIDKNSGLLCKEKDIQGLMRNLIYLLENQNMWPKMGEIGRKHVGKNYNLKLQIQKLENIYDLLTSTVMTKPT